MKTHEELIRENRELTRRLELAQSWMRREVDGRRSEIEREGVTRETRKHFSNIFEEGEREMLVQKVQSDFGDTLEYAPEFTLERLIDAEIYWYMLQKFPHMDAFPVVASYQKILDSWIEDILVHPWRLSKKSSYHTTSSMEDPFERDLSSLVLKDYTLSIGRFFKLLLLFQADTKRSLLVSDLEEYWRKHFPKTFSYLLGDAFFPLFSLLIEREIFSSKRHERKVSYKDAQKTREILIGTEKDGILRSLFYSTELDKR